MALFTVKPSRGTVVFFVLLFIALGVRHGWQRHERSLVQRDTPPAHTARRLLRCVIGRTAQRYMGPRPASAVRGNAWAMRINARLEQLVTSEHEPDWPARCAPIAERLAVRLVGRPETQRAAYFAHATARSLRAASEDRLQAIGTVARGELAEQLASLAMEVSAMSGGAEEGWNSPMADAPTDLWPVRLVVPPLPAAVAPGAIEYATFAMPDVVLYQDLADRRLHMATFDASEHLRADRVLGRGAPVRGAQRDGAVLVATDEGDSVFLPGGEPAQLVPLPDAVRSGAESAVDWQVALTPTLLWLLTNDDGALRVRTTPREGSVRWSENVLTLGAADVFAGAVLAAEGAGDAVRVTAARRGAVGVWVEQYVVVAEPTPVAQGGAGNAVGPARGGGLPSRGAPRPATAATTAASATDAETTSTATNAAATATNTATTATSTASTSRGAVLRVGDASVVVREWPTFDARVHTCTSGGTQFVMVRGAEELSMVRVAGAQATRQEFPYSVWGTPVGGRYDFSCSPQGALLFLGLTGAPGALVFFEGGSGTPAVLTPPMFTPAARVLGAALTRDGTVVTLVSDGAMRSYFSNDRGARWRGGDLVVLPSHGGDFSPAAFAAEGEQVAVLGEMTVRGRRLVGRLGSRDANRAFHGE